MGIIMISIVLSYLFLCFNNWPTYGYFIYPLTLVLTWVGYFIIKQSYLKKYPNIDKMNRYQIIQRLIIVTILSYLAYIPLFTKCSFSGDDEFACTVVYGYYITALFFAMIPFIGIVLLIYRKIALKTSPQLCDFGIIAEINLPFFYLGGFCLAFVIMGNKGILIGAAICLLFYFILIPTYGLIKKIISKQTFISIIVSALIIEGSFYLTILNNPIPNLYYYLFGLHLLMIGLFIYLFIRKEGNPFRSDNPNLICLFRGIVVFDISEIFLLLWLGLQNMIFFFLFILVLIGMWIYVLIGSSRIWKKAQNG